MNLLCMRRQTGLPTSIGVAGAALATAPRHRTHLTLLQRALRRH